MSCAVPRSCRRLGPADRPAGTRRASAGPPGLLLFVGLLAAGCTGAAPDTAAVCTADDRLVDWPTWGDGFFAGYCRTCHSASSPERHDAPDGVNFDTPEEVRAYAASIRAAVLDDGTMPIGGGVPPSELATLDVYLACGP